MNHMQHVERKYSVNISFSNFNKILEYFFYCLEKYPEIKQLMGHDWRMSIQVAISVFSQIIIAILLREASWLKLFFFAYVIGGTINHTLSLALHELTHNLAFGHSRPMSNRLLGFFANLPLGVPASITLKKYHLDHHR
jgi:sphingolipid delta-4 desaturase